ncbi:hypothetical protein MASR2M66_32560 [Chloroflexota bacterium]
MKFKNRKASTYLLILGMIFLVIGMITDNTVFTWISIVLVFLSLILGGRWLRPRNRR